MPRPRALWLLCALCAALAPLSASKPALLTVGTPLSQLDGLAVCNDGSPSGYYFVPGTTQSNIWLVYLEGGMWYARGAGAAFAAAALAARAHPAFRRRVARLRTARGPHAPGAGGECRPWLPCGCADAAARSQVL